MATMTACGTVATKSENHDLETPIEWLGKYSIDESKLNTLGDIINIGYPEALSIIDKHNTDKDKIIKLEAKRKNK